MGTGGFGCEGGMDVVWLVFRITGASEKSLLFHTLLWPTALIGRVELRLGDGIPLRLDMIPSSTLGGCVGEKGNVRRDVGGVDGWDTMERLGGAGCVG